MTLFALHGFAGRPAFLASLAAVDPGRIAHAESLAGHGPLPAPVTTFEDEVRRLTRCALACPGSILLYGYSLGARLGVGVADALAAAGRLEGAVFVGLEPGLSGADERAARCTLDDSRAATLRKDGVSAFLETWTDQPLFASQARLPEAVRTARAAARAEHAAGPLADALAAFSPGRMPDLRPALARLAGLAGSVVFVAGALDTKFVARAHEACAGTPGGRVVVVPAVGHDVLLEDAPAMLQIVRGACAPRGSQP